MSDYTELVKALRLIAKEQDCNECEAGRWHHDFECCLFEDAAAAIEDLQAEVRFWEAAVKGQEDGIKVLQTEVKRLKECNDELREAQTYIDHYGDKWLTSAKDVPTSAYNHGYMDGKYEALTLERCIDRLHELGWLQEHDRILSQPHWVSVEEPPRDGQECIIAYSGPTDWIYEHATYHSDLNEALEEDVFIEGTDGFIVDEDVGYARHGLFKYWMPLPEPPKEVQDADR